MCPWKEHPEEGPGSPGNGASVLRTPWKCLFQTFRSTLQIRGAVAGEWSCHCCVSLCLRWHIQGSGHEAGRVLGLCLRDPLNWFHLSRQDSQDLKHMCLSLGSVLGAVPAAEPKSSLQGLPHDLGARRLHPPFLLRCFWEENSIKNTLANVWVIFGIDGAIWLQLCKGSPFFTLSLWVLSCRVVQSLLKTVPKCQTWKDTAL